MRRHRCLPPRRQPGRLLPVQRLSGRQLIDSIGTRLPDRSQPTFYHRFYDNYCCILSIGTAAKATRLPPACPQMIDELAGDNRSTTYPFSPAVFGRRSGRQGDDQLAIKNLIRSVATTSPATTCSTSNAIFITRWLNFTAAPAIIPKPAATTNWQTRQTAVSPNAAMPGLDLPVPVKYETREKEQQTSCFHSEVELKKTIKYNIVIIISLLLLGCVFAICLIMRQRTLKLQHIADCKQHELDLIRQREARLLLEEKERLLRQMLNDRQELNRKNEELSATNSNSSMPVPACRKLSTTCRPASSPPKKNRISVGSSDLFIRHSQPPAQSLPRPYPQQELLAMLIRLQLTTDEIAFCTLETTARASTPHVRACVKMEIQKDISLEEYLKDFNLLFQRIKAVHIFVQ